MREFMISIDPEEVLETVSKKELIEYIVINDTVEPDDLEIFLRNMTDTDIVEAVFNDRYIHDPKKIHAQLGERLRTEGML